MRPHKPECPHPSRTGDCVCLEHPIANRFIRHAVNRSNYGILSPDVMLGRPTECATANPCPVCGSDGDMQSECPVADSLVTDVICQIADLKRPDDGWPDGIVDEIVEAAKFVANY